jgi:5-(carboxyamino)imidazole ribonucleotide synthase
MLALEARRLGYLVAVLDPDAHCPCSGVADSMITAAFDDPDALARLASVADVVTLEFENIPAAPLENLATTVPLHPAPHVLHICQNREREKMFLRSHGFPCANFAIAADTSALADAVTGIGFPCVVKTAAFGYDGKGQVRISSRQDLAEAIDELAGKRLVVEEWVPFERECSVICARGAAGKPVCLPPAENLHRNHVLDVSIVPARLNPGVLAEAQRIACEITEQLDVVGLLAVEFFIRSDGSILVNELAPRPHNSGHYSMNACSLSQFELHLRAVCGLPLPEPELLRSAIMLNLLGDLWEGAGIPWAELLQDPNLALHLYGKTEARKGRKMGHVNLLTHLQDGPPLPRLASLRQRLGMPSIPG